MVWRTLWHRGGIFTEFRTWGGGLCSCHYVTVKKPDTVCSTHTHTQVKTHSVYLNLFLFVFLIYICLCVCADCSVRLSLTPKKIQLEIKLTRQSELPCCLESEITFQQFLSLTSRHTDVHWWWKSARKDKKKKKFNLLKHVLKAVIKVKTITLNQLHLCFHFPHS